MCIRDSNEIGCFAQDDTFVFVGGFLVVRTAKCRSFDLLLNSLLRPGAGATKSDASLRMTLLFPWDGLVTVRNRGAIFSCSYAAVSLSRSADHRVCGGAAGFESGGAEDLSDRAAAGERGAALVSDLSLIHI